MVPLTWSPSIRVYRTWPVVFPLTVPWKAKNDGQGLRPLAVVADNSAWCAAGTVPVALLRVGGSFIKLTSGGDLCRTPIHDDRATKLPAPGCALPTSSAGL